MCTHMRRNRLFTHQSRKHNDHWFWVDEERAYSLYLLHRLVHVSFYLPGSTQRCTFHPLFPGCLKWSVCCLCLFLECGQDDEMTWPQLWVTTDPTNCRCSTVAECFRLYSDTPILTNARTGWQYTDSEIVTMLYIWLLSHVSWKNFQKLRICRSNCCDVLTCCRSISS